MSGLRAHLDHCEKIVPVDADRAVCTAQGLIPVSGIRIIRRSLEMGGQDVFDVLHRHLFLRYHAPRKIIRNRCEIRMRSVPHLRVRIQIALHEPRTRRVVYMIRIVMAAERVARMKLAIL